MIINPFSLLLFLLPRWPPLMPLTSILSQFLSTMNEPQGQSLIHDFDMPNYKKSRVTENSTVFLSLIKCGIKCRRTAPSEDFYSTEFLPPAVMPMKLIFPPTYFHLALDLGHINLRTGTRDNILGGSWPWRMLPVHFYPPGTRRSVSTIPVTPSPPSQRHRFHHPFLNSGHSRVYSVWTQADHYVRSSWAASPFRPSYSHDVSLYRRKYWNAPLCVRICSTRWDGYICDTGPCVYAIWRSRTRENRWFLYSRQFGWMA
jgi:hypothetical protein